MNVKETLKRLHKKFPMMGLDELFDVLDCYVEYDDNTSKWLDYKKIPTWEQPKIWYSTDKTTSETPKINSITSKNANPEIYTVNTNLPYGEIKYYDGAGTAQPVAEH